MSAIHHFMVSFLMSCVLGACVTTPGNGGHVENTTSSVTFSGFGLSPGRRVTLEASASASGPFVPVPGVSASTSSRASSSITLARGGTVPLYDFSMSAVIPASRWHTPASTHCASAETFVRVRDGNASYLTFDTDADALACIQDHINGGQAPDDALLACRSAQSPVLKLIQGVSVHVGNVVVDDATDVAALDCIQTIEGSLTVTSTAPNVIALPRLRRVTGDVNLTYTSYAPDPHPPSSSYEAMRCGALRYVTAEVRSYDLPSFTTVGGNITLHQEGSFSGGASTQAIDLHLNALTAVGGDVSITIGQFGGSPCGLTAIPSLPGNLTVEFSGGGEVDSSITGLLSSVTTVGGTVAFLGGHNSFGNPLAAMTEAGGLHVIKRPYLSGFHFPSLTSVSGTVELDGTGPSSNPSGLANVGTLIVRNSWYNSLELVGGPKLSVGNLELHDNASLTALTTSGASKVALAPTASFTLDNNAALPSDEVCSFVSLQSRRGWSGPSALDGATCP